jgi:hypothetical protein
MSSQSRHTKTAYTLSLIVLAAAILYFYSSRLTNKVRIDGLENPYFYKGVVEVKMVDQKTLYSLYEKYGKKVPTNGNLKGFAGRGEDGRCVIFITPVKKVDDDATLTLGHELLHCMWGNYHD